VVEDLSEAAALFGHGLCAALTEADAVSLAGTFEEHMLALLVRIGGEAGSNPHSSTRNVSLRGKEVEDLPHHALCLISLKEKLSVRRAI